MWAYGVFIKDHGKWSKTPVGGQLWAANQIDEVAKNVKRYLKVAVKVMRVSNWTEVK